VRESQEVARPRDRPELSCRCAPCLAGPQIQHYSMEEEYHMESRTSSTKFTFSLYGSILTLPKTCAGREANERSIGSKKSRPSSVLNLLLFALTTMSENRQSYSPGSGILTA
jgi:hypothetical protein